MPRTSEVRLTSQDNSTLTVRQPAPSPTAASSVLLAITTADGTAASIQLTDHSVRVLLAILEGYLDPTGRTSPDGLPRVTIGAPAERPADSAADLISAHQGSRTAAPDPKERLAAQIAVEGAVESRRQAATWLAQLYCEQAAYAIAVTYPEAASIVVELSSPSEDSLTVARLLDILDADSAPMFLPADEIASDATYWAVATVVERNLEAALTLGSDLLPWAGRHTLVLSDYTTW